MRLTWILLVTAALIMGAAVPGTADPSASSDTYFGASSSRLIGDKDSFTIQYVGAARWFDAQSGELRESAGYGEITCKRSTKRRWFTCYFDPSKQVRLKVESFQMDMTLESASLQASSRKGKVNLTWTGRGDREPDAGQHMFEDLDIHRGGQFFAGAGASLERRARLSGKLFGHGFNRAYSGLYEGTQAWGGGCVSFGLKCFIRAVH